MRVNSKPQKEVLPLYEPQPIINKKPIIHNLIILDASGSMRGPKYNAAKEGIILELDELKKDNNADYTSTVIEFGSANNVKTHHFQVPINDISNIFWYGAELGMTALYDVVGGTIQRLLANIKNDEKFLIKIFTDGGENDSRYFSASKLRSLISEAENKGFTITFEGTQLDTQSIINNLHINSTNTHIHDNTPEGIMRGVKSRISATISYSKSVAEGKDVTFNFYSKSVE